MLGGPRSGLTATISVPVHATLLAAMPIFRVMAAVVFGLMTSIRTSHRLSSELAAEIELPYPIIVEQIGGIPGERHLPGRHRVSASRDPQRHARILLDEQHADLLVAIDGDNRA